MSADVVGQLTFFCTELVNLVRFLVKVFALIVVGSAKALLPRGLLPRKSVQGRNVLITGAGSGMGRELAIKFSQLGANVVLWDVNAEGNNGTKGLVEAIGSKAHAYTVDLTSPDQINEIAGRVQTEVGAVDLVINCAGVVSGRRFVDTPDHLIRRTIDVNTTAAMITTKAFLPAMLARNDGHIVTISSIAGHVGVVGLVDYCASKFGAVGFMDALHRELYNMGSDVKTTCVGPFFVDTGMFEGVKKSKVPGILPFLRTDFVVDAMLDAILTDQQTLLLPKSLYLIKAVQCILPQSAIDYVYDELEVDNFMDTFRGRH